MLKHEIMGTLDFLRRAEKLKETLRSAHTSSGHPESTAEHTWRLCLLALVLSPELGDIDVAKLLKICIVHDLAEAITGDTPAIMQTDDGQKSLRERAAIKQLAEPLPARQQAEIVSLWEEYEQGSSLEAVLAKGLDNLETLLQHKQGRNPPDSTTGSTWVTARGTLRPILCCPRSGRFSTTERVRGCASRRKRVSDAAAADPAVASRAPGRCDRLLLPA